MITDKKRLDFLEHLTSDDNNIICRWSNRGWRLHETSQDGVKSIREAIDRFIIEEAEKAEKILKEEKEDKWGLELT